MKNKITDCWIIVFLCYALIGFTLIGAQEPDLKRALSLVNEGKTNEAIRILHQEVEKDSNTADVHLALGVAYLEGGDYDSAKGSLERALQLDPSSVPVHYTLAMLYEKEQKYAKSVQEWGKVLQLTDDSDLKELADKHIRQLEGIK